MGVAGHYPDLVGRELLEPDVVGRVAADSQGPRGGRRDHVDGVEPGVDPDLERLRERASRLLCEDDQVHVGVDVGLYGAAWEADLCYFRRAAVLPTPADQVDRRAVLLGQVGGGGRVLQRESGCLGGADGVLTEVTDAETAGCRSDVVAGTVAGGVEVCAVHEAARGTAGHELDASDGPVDGDVAVARGRPDLAAGRGVVRGEDAVLGVASPQRDVRRAGVRVDLRAVDDEADRRGTLRYVRADDAADFVEVHRRPGDRAATRARATGVVRLERQLLDHGLA